MVTFVRLWAPAAAAATAAALLGTVPVPAVAGVPAYHPTRLTHLGDARQVVVVTSGSWGSSHATVRRFARRADGWREVGAAVRGRLGRNGFVVAADRRQSTGTSPAGTFGLVSAFGNGPDPGASLPYRPVDRNDWWVYDPRDPSTYNVFQPRRPRDARWRTSWAEDLSAYGGQYRYAVVLDYNLPSAVHPAPSGGMVADQPADTRRGGGIFLHVNGPGATSGCVSVPRGAMRRILTWLDPVKRPVIVMGPRSAIDRL